MPGVSAVVTRERMACDTAFELLVRSDRFGVLLNQLTGLLNTSKRPQLLSG